MNRLKRIRRNRLHCEPLEDRRLLAIVPNGFTETPVVTGLTSPVTMDIDNSGRIFLAFQNGRIDVIENDQLLPTPFATLDADGSGERGLQGIELDPNYETNGYIYVYYTAANPSSHNRVSRLTIDPTTENTAIPGSETVLLDLPNLSTVGNPIWHMGGAIHFADDGTLLVQVGDHQDTSKPQNLDHPFGKMLRINTDGSVPTDNPWYDAGNGITWRDYVWSAGLRNPFSGDVNPETGQVFVNDVGAGTWEEINDATAGGLNFGWPTTEGNFNPATYPDFSNPFHAYSHSVDCAITGGAFYQPPLLQFPVEYHGKYFYSQFCRGEIRVIDPANPADIEVFATDAEFPMNIEFGPDGSMYYVARGAGAGGNPGTGTGRVLKVESDVQVPPSIVSQPQDTLVSAGYDATFVVEATGNLPLNYQWQSRPSGGSFSDISGATASTLELSEVSLAEDGLEVRVMITNAFGSITSDAATLNVTTDQPPVVSIDSPVAGTNYVGGQQFQFSGSAVDNEDGILDGSSMTWQIDFHHDDHLHPFFPETSGISSGSFTIPNTGETSPNVWYRIRLTVTDSAGLTTTVFRDVDPVLSSFTVTNNVGDNHVQLDGSPRPAFESVTGVVGIERTIAAAQSAVDGLTAYPFMQWLDGDTNLQRTFATPGFHETYAALYGDPQGLQVFLSDLEVANYNGLAGLEPFQRDLSFNRNPITLSGVQYHRGMGVRSHSDLAYSLNGQYSRFLTDIGVDDEVGAGGSVTFQVLADGLMVFDSGPMNGDSATQSLDLDVSGVQELRLLVEDNGDGSMSDHADWAAARLIKSDAVPGPDIRINFQLDGVAVPAGYLADTGVVYGDRGNGLTYGWTSDHTDVSRDRGVNPDQRLDTLVHFHDNQQWEIEVPNGVYTVTVAIGDAGFATTQTLIAEGASYWTGEFTEANEFRRQSQVVRVNDGRLTLGVASAADKATRINYVEITPGGESLPLAPYRDADINLDGTLDESDTAQFAANWRTDTTGMSTVDAIQNGDFDFSGETNFADWEILRQAFARANSNTSSLVDPVVAEAARDTLLDGVTDIAVVGAPGRIAVFDPPNVAAGQGSFSVIHDGDYRSMVAASIWGSGRVVAFGHNGYTHFGNAGDSLDTGQLYLNSLSWLSGSTSSAIQIVTPSSSTRDWLQNQGFTNVLLRSDWENHLTGADVLVAELGPNVSLAKQTAVSSFVQGGGGLVTGGTGWGYKQLGHDLLTLDGNEILRDAGLGWADGFRNGTTNATNRSSTLGNATSALGFADQFWMGGGGSAAQQEEAGEALLTALSVLPTGHALGNAIDISFADRASLVEATPVSPVDNALDQAVLTWESNGLQATPPNQVTIHHTAEAVYGTIPSGADRITDTVEIDTSRSRWHATGLYAAPGELVTVTVPPALVGQAKVRINAHTDDISPRDQWERMPVVHRSFDIDQATVQVANAFGGLLFIDLGSSAPNIGNLEITIHNAIEAPYFDLSQHTDQEWNDILRDRPAPFGVLVSDGLIVSLPKHQIESADLTKPQELMEWWNQVVTLQDDLADQAQFRTSAELINVDVQNSAGAAHAGFPIQAYERFWGNLADLAELKQNGSWGDFHELGHNHQRGWWTFSGDGEVSVNIFSNYVMETLSPDSSNFWAYSSDPVATLQTAISDVSQGGSYSSKSDRWSFWFQLADGFGWDTYRNVFAGYEADAASNPGNLPSNDQAEKDQWFTRWSQEVGYNMERFMVDTWGLSVSASAINTVGGLPDWMPLATTIGDFQVDFGNPVILNLAGGGLGMDGVAAFAGIESQPTLGTLTMNGNGTYSYQPSVPGGQDSFVVTYQSSAGNTQDFVIDVTIGNGFLAGDVNLDGTLDMLDLTQFIAGWRSDTTGLSDEEKIQLGDLNLDGSTDFADFHLLRQAWNLQFGASRPFLKAWQIARSGEMSTSGLRPAEVNEPESLIDQALEEWNQERTGDRWE